jgi:hypothetical protein
MLLSELRRLMADRIRQGKKLPARKRRRKQNHFTFETLEDRQLMAADVLYRVNAGGGALAGDWVGDTSGSPSIYSNVSAAQSKTTSVSSSINMTHASLPVGTPEALFKTERWDQTTGAEMQWDFAVAAGTYEVRLYFAETYSKAQKVGGRVFDVLIEGQTVLDNYDVYADVGGYKGVMKSFIVNADTNIDIDFLHGVQNPAIKGIEILRTQVGNELGSSHGSLDFAGTLIGNTLSKTFTLTNLGQAGDPSITVDPAQISITGSGASQFSFQTTTNGPATLAPGQSLVVTVRFTCTDAALRSAVLNIPHSGDNSPLSIGLSGSGVATVPIGFGKSTLGGEVSSRPTSLQFGPDDRLYVATQDGLIHIYTIARTGANNYDVVSVETITSIQQIANHDDDGTLNTEVNERLVTGILVTGTADNPVIFVTSSDPRIGAGPSGDDLNLDTNSGILSRLTWNGSSWVKVDLVRGLPRSEENHAANGMALDTATNTLYIAQGGNTNMGAPSNNFALLPEYALSAAILSVDLDAIGNSTYDIPTLDDEDRPTNNDANDPFGGNDGKNQARIVPGGPVQVYAPGFRNPYDLVLTADGRLYTIDNGPNGGWGNVPKNEGPAGNATNERNESGSTHNDGLHFITGPGFYGGHPNPTRSNMNNTFNSSNPQSPVSQNNPIESDYITPGQGDGSLFTWGSSTNGLVEYTASNFQGSMKGNLLAASFDNSIKRISLNAAGDGVVAEQKLFSSVGSVPLDVTAVGDEGLFPGTIWACDIVNGNIYVFEPSDFERGTGGGPDPDPQDENDLDGDGYLNDDETANGTNPNSAADVPPDFDLDFISNLTDDDDDNDGQLDNVDPFAIDSNNGMTTYVGVSYLWENDSPAAGGLLNMGFTGLMTNGVDNYANLYDTTKLTAGGAAGVLTIDEIGEGDATGASDSQTQAFQYGVNLSNASGPVTAHTRVLAAFEGETPAGNQSMGMYIGTGDQDNYLKVVLTANNGNPGITFVREVNGVVTTGDFHSLALPGLDSIDLYLTVDLETATVQVSYQIGHGERIELGSPIAVPESWLAGANALAVGLISTSVGSAPPIAATWDFLEVVQDAASNIAPVLAPITNPTVEAGKTITIPVSASDAEGDNIVLNAVNLPSFATFVDHGDGTGTLTLAPNASQAAGAYNFTITATDDGSPVLFDSQTITATVTAPIASGTVMYRVNAGGGALAGGWAADTKSAPSPHSNVSAAKSDVTSVTTGINTSHASVPVGTPAALFQTERWDQTTGTDMQWDFAVTAGTYEVRLYFAETYSKAQKIGGRVFDVMIEGVTVLDNFDVFAEVGKNKGLVKSFMVSADSNIDIDFLRGVQNPSVKGIEIIKVNAATEANVLDVNATSHDFGSLTVGQTETFQVQITNEGGAGDPSITINRDGTLLSGGGSDQYVFNYTSAGPITLAPGQSTLIEVTFRPTQAGTALATLTIPHSGTNPPINVSFTGNGLAAPVVSPSATVEVDDGGTMSDSSTYGSGSFKITNSSANGANITSVRLDISRALLADVVFDPDGTAGDPVGKDFTANSGGSATGLTGHAFGSPLHTGYQLLDVAFSDFDPGETFTFSADIDPTTIRGAADPGPEASGSTSGFELIGSQVTITFSDGTTLTTDLYRKGTSLTGSTATVKNGAPAAPTMQVLNIGATPATTSTAAQTLRIFGTAGATVQLLKVESALHLAGVPGGGYDVDAYESNKAIAASEQSITIGAGGFVDVPVTLTKTHADGGYNHFIAVTKSADGLTSAAAKVLLKYEPSTTPPPVDTGDVVYRVNAGGGALSGGWAGDTKSNPSSLSNASAAKSQTTSVSTTIDMSHASIPVGTPMSLFQTERWDDSAGSEMQWDFAVAPGSYEVRLYFAETYSGAQKIGGRVFDVMIDGQLVLDNYDIFADVGKNKAVMKSFTITSDGNIDIDFLRGVQNPSIKGIEIVRVS